MLCFILEDYIEFYIGMFELQPRKNCIDSHRPTKSEAITMNGETLTIEICKFK